MKLLGKNVFKATKSSMEAEIYEQSKVLSNLVQTYHLSDLELPENVKKVVIVASGTSYHCAKYAVGIFETYAGIEAQAIYSSELLLKNVIPHDEGTLYIFITQSGETSDTLMAVKKVEEYGLDTLCITNKANSSIWNMCKYKIDTKAGEEKSIAATKSFTTQVFCILVIALKLAESPDKKNLTDWTSSENDSEQVKTLVNSITQIPEIVEKTLDMRKKIKQLARLICKDNCAFVVADGIAHALALETALKIKETSFKNINPALMGEFMHGHVAVFNNKKSALVYVSVSGIPYNTIQYLNKIKKDYNPSIYIIGKPNEKFSPNFNISVDCNTEILQAFSNIVIAQLLALEIAIRLGRDIDNPNGLQKVVKVG